MQAIFKLKSLDSLWRFTGLEAMNCFYVYHFKSHTENRRPSEKGENHN